MSDYNQAIQDVLQVISKRLAYIEKHGEAISAEHGIQPSDLTVVEIELLHLGTEIESLSWGPRKANNG